MFQILHDITIDWLGNRRWFIGVSLLLMLAGLGSAIFRQATGGQAFNLGVDFKGGTVVTAKFKQRPSDETIRAALDEKGVRDAVVQSVRDSPDTVLIKVPLEGEGQDGRARVREALNTFGSEAAPAVDLAADANASYKIVGTEAVGAIERLGIGLACVLGKNFLGEAILRRHHLQSFHRRLDQPQDHLPILRDVGFARRDALGNKLNAELAIIRWADELAVAFFGQHVVQRQRDHRAVDGVAAHAGGGFGLAPHLQDRGVLDAVVIEDHANGEVRHCAQPRHADLFAAQVFRFFDRRLHHQRDGERRQIGNGHHVAAARHAGDNHGTGHARHRHGAGKHRLNDQRRGAHENQIDVHVVLAENAGVLGDHPRQTAVIRHRVGK